MNMMGYSREGINDFFKARVTVFVGEEQEDSEDLSRLRDSLEALPFDNVEYIPVTFDKHSPQITLYHRGDLVYARRLEYFLNYAAELEDAA